MESGPGRTGSITRARCPNLRYNIGVLFTLREVTAMAERVPNSSLRIRTLVLLALIASGCFIGGCSDEAPAVTSTAVTGASTPAPQVSVTEPTQLSTPQTPVQPTESIVGQTGGGVFSGDTIKIGVDLPT